jgi:hypothetical protein
MGGSCERDRVGGLDVGKLRTCRLFLASIKTPLVAAKFLTTFSSGGDVETAERAFTCGLLIDNELDRAAGIVPH